VKAKPEAELGALIDRLGPKEQKLFREVRAAIRRRLPTTNELGYDYTTFVVTSYSATDRAIDATLALAGRPNGVQLYLVNGPRLSDPKKLLRGSGKATRYIALESASQLSNPDVRALVDAAIELTPVPLAVKGKGALIMKTNDKKKAPRAKAKTKTKTKAKAKK